MKIHKYFNFTFRLNDCFCAFFYVQPNKGEFTVNRKNGSSYSDSFSSLQSEFMRKFVSNGAAIPNLPLHLPVPQRLILKNKHMEYL